MGNAAVKDGACPQSAQQCLKFGWPFVRPMSILVDHLLGQFYSHVILSCSSHCYTLSSCCLPFIFILRSRPTSVHFSSSFFIFFPTDLQLSLALFCPHSLSLFVYVFFFAICACVLARARVEPASIHGRGVASSDNPPFFFLFLKCFISHFGVHNAT